MCEVPLYNPGRECKTDIQTKATFKQRVDSTSRGTPDREQGYLIHEKHPLPRTLP